VARQPAASSLRDAEIRVAERTDAVRIRVDDETEPRLAGQPRVCVAQVEPVRLRVDLEEGAGLERRLDGALDVDVRGWAHVDPARGEMPDAVDVRVRHGGQDALGRAAVEAC